MKRLAVGLLAAGLVMGQSADALFDAAVLHDIQITIHPTDWQRLKDNYLENTYYLCDLQWRSLKVENIGIRSRGLGSRSGLKPGLRVDFDRFQTTQSFLGLKSLVLDNFTQDPSMLHERLTMRMFERMGLPAPREAHARLYVNGVYVGLYGVVEAVDKRMLSRVFGENDGYLYEYKWVEDYRFEDRGSDPARYAPVPFKPVTHEKDPDHKPLVEMIRAMHDAGTGEFRKAMEPYLDLKVLMRHVAVENFLSDFDGVLGEWGMNNFYLYRFEGKKKWQLIAWDKDVSFYWEHYPIWTNVYTNPVMRRSLEDPELRDAYLESLLKLAALAGEENGWLEREIVAGYRQIRTAAWLDKQKPYTNEQFEEAVEKLVEFVRARGRFVREEVASSGISRAERPNLTKAILEPSSPVVAVYAIGMMSEAVQVYISGYLAELISVEPGLVRVKLPLMVPPESAAITVFVDGVPGNTVPLELSAP